MKENTKQLLAVLLVFATASVLAFLLYHQDNKYTHSGTQPIAGMLFIEESDWQDTPLRFLWNGWQFYPDRLLTPQDRDGLDTTKLISVKIGEHNNFSGIIADSTPGGQGTYLLTLQLPDIPHTYALWLPEIFSACRFYVEDQLLMEMGNPDSANYLPSVQSRIVSFTASGTTRLMLAVRNESHFYSGLVYPPAFGKLQTVLRQHDLRLFICAVFLTAALLSAAFSLWVSLRSHRRESKIRLFFYLCLCIAVFISYSVVHSLFPMAIQPWYTIEILSAYLITLFIVLLHNRLCDVPPRISKISGLVVFLFCLIMFLYAALASRLTLPIAEAFAVFIPLFKAGAAIYLLLTSFFALGKQEPKRSLIFYANLFYAAMMLWERLLPAYEPILGGWFPEWGGLALVIALSILLWQDVAMGYRLSLTLQEEHRQMERQIEMQQEHYLQISYQVEESRRLRHDFRQHLLVITGLADDKSALMEYMNKIASMSEAVRPESYCDNLAVDALLYHYINTARLEGYLVKTQIEAPKQAPIPDEVIFCTILGNLMENALEALRRQKQGEHFIHLYIRWKEQDIFLLLENSFDGGLEKSRRGYFSRKHEGEGLGVISIRQLTKKLGGNVEFVNENNLFKVMLVLPIEKASDNETYTV